MCHYASTPSKHQFVAVNTKHDHIPVQRNRISHLIELFSVIYYQYVAVYADLYFF